MAVIERDGVGRVKLAFQQSDHEAARTLASTATPCSLDRASLT